MAAPAVVEPFQPEEPVTALTLLPMGDDLMAGVPPSFSIELDERGPTPSPPSSSGSTLSKT